VVVDDQVVAEKSFLGFPEEDEIVAAVRAKLA
jgi:hypothetical protein